jgi:hypothetical protein
MERTPNRDRYLTFEGLDCDANATKLVATIREHLSSPGEAMPWATYFEGKLLEKQRLGVDDLFFVGSQLNNLYAFFDQLGDHGAQELLYQVEQECC